jgi:hypothetical protein
VLGLFPKPANEELFYSVVARYSALLGPSRPAFVQEDVFGRRLSIATWDLPTRIRDVLSQLPDGHELAPGQLIERHTLFPYYAPFVSSECATHARTLMEEGGGRALLYALRARPVGVTHSATFHLCRACVEDDENSVGMPTWRRVHQLPGVAVCPTHGMPLSNTSVRRHALIGRNAYVAASTAHIQGDVLRDPNVPLPMLHRIANDSLLLLANRVPVIDSSIARVRLLYSLHQAGWCRSNGRLRLQDLIEALAQHYGQTAHCWLGLAIASESSWLRRMLRSEREAPNALHWIVVLQFLGIPLTAFFGVTDGVAEDWFRDRNSVRKRRDGNPGYSGHHRVVLSVTGDGAPCNNAVCPYAGTTVPGALQAVHAVAVNRVLSSCGTPEQRTIVEKNTLLVVRCDDCGHVYSWHPSHGPRVKRVETRGLKWDDALRELVGAGHTMREIARRLNSTWRTVAAHALRLGVLPPGLKVQTLRPAAKEARRERLIASHRRTVLAALASDPHLMRHKRDPSFSGAWAKLWKYDRAWLEANMPFAVGERKRYTADWAAREATLIPQIEGAVAVLRAATFSEERPVRISVRRIDQQLGGVPTLRFPATRARMPGVESLLATVTETPDAFARRRLAWAAHRYEAEGRAPTSGWALMARAGVLGCHAKLLREEAERLAVERRLALELRGR